ncbi:MAG: hypothetical protein ACRC1M_06830 [Methanobacteriaceae archaeon]
MKEKMILAITGLAIVLIMFTSLSTISAAVTPVDGNNSTLAVNGTSTIQNALNNLSASADSKGNGTIYLNEKNYNGSGNTNITINTQRNITIIGNGTGPKSTIINGSKISWFLTNTGSGQLTLINLTFVDFYRNGNGAVISNSANLFLIITNCSFVNNSVTGKGGAIYYSTSGTASMILEDCSFVNNSANNDGGAIYNKASNFKVFNSLFAKNVAKGGTGGGAIYNSGYSMNFGIFNSKFINNSAPYGGAIIDDLSDNTIINNSDFINNSATNLIGGSGGAFYGRDTFYVTINHSNFTNNTAYVGGGACSLNGNEYSEIINSSFIANTGRDGGAIEDNWNENLNIISCDFVNNSANYGGAIYNYRLSKWTNITNCSFLSNNISIFINGTNTTVLGSNFTKNNVSILIRGNNTTVLGCNIINNSQGIIVNNSAFNSTVNYNRLFNNTMDSGFNLINMGVNTNANFNWWGYNDPKVDVDYNGIIINNFFIASLITNSTKVINGSTIILNYGFNLDDGSSAYNELLPYFVADIESNTFDARFNKSLNYTVSSASINGSVDNQLLKILINIFNSNASINGNIVLDNSSYYVNSSVYGIILVVNDGNVSASDVVVKVKFPSNWVLNNVVFSKGSFDYNTNTWYIGDLDPGEKVNLTFDGYFTKMGNYTFDILISGFNFNNISDNTNARVVTNNPNISVVGSVILNKKVVAVNETVSGLVSVKNTGAFNATNVMLKLNIPSSFLPVIKGSSRAFSFNDFNIVTSKGTFDYSTGIWYIGNLTKGETVSLTFEGRFAKIGNYTFDIFVSGDNFNSSVDDDSVRVVINNVNTSVVGSIVLDKDVVKVNETVRGSIVVRNTGNNTAFGVVVVKVKFPNNWVLGSMGVPSKGKFDSTTNTWYVGDLAPGEEATLSFTGKFIKVGNYTFNIDVSGSNFDSSSDSDSIKVKNGSKPSPVPSPKPVSANGVSMENTGIPFFVLVLALFGLLACGLRFRKKN